MVIIEEQMKYIKNLKYININSEEEYNKLNKKIYSLSIYCNININKLPNKIIKFSLWYDYYNYLNNLPLNLKYLYSSYIVNCSHRVNCNLPPNIIYLNFYVCDVNNLPRSLQFINIYDIKFIIPKELNDNNYNKNKKEKNCIFKVLL